VAKNIESELIMKIRFCRKSKTKILAEILRKSWHFFAGLVLITGYSMLTLYFSRSVALFSCVALLLAAMIFEHVRLSYRPRVIQAIDVLFRKKEFNHPSAMLSFITSFVLIFAVFNHDIAFAASMMMIVGDSFSAAFGMLFGTTKIRGNKTFVGSFSGLAANLIVGYFALNGEFMLFIPMALTATIVEMLTNKLDDNLTVPVATAFVGQMLFILLKITVL